MYCKNCGKEIKDDSTFCIYCGTSISTSVNFSEKPIKKKYNFAFDIFMSVITCGLWLIWIVLRPKYINKNNNNAFLPFKNYQEIKQDIKGYFNKLVLFQKTKKEERLEKRIEELKFLLTPEQQKIEFLNEKLKELNTELLSLNNNIKSAKTTLTELNRNKIQLEKEIKEKEDLLVSFDSLLLIPESGLYEPYFEFASSSHYKDKLNEIREEQKELVRNGGAIYGTLNWVLDGSAIKGQKMLEDYKKLLLRAFNIECNNIVANVKVSNLDHSIDKLYKVKEQIERLGKFADIKFSFSYVDLKSDEIYLALDYQQKKQEEKDRIKELKIQEREAAKAQKELEEKKLSLKKEQSHYENALNAIELQIKKTGSSAELLEKKEQLQSQIIDTLKAIEDVDYRVANNKAGYVYIISNIGSFGENVYKIGMTRRLEPQERIDELGGASVPFKFDTHALIFTEDAPALEAALHKAFEDKKINKVNPRKEFFRVSLEKIKEEVQNNFDKTVEWVDIPDADQYRQSIED